MKYFILIINIYLGLISNASGKNEFPAPEDKTRHISFQAGKLGQKPWDPEASFGVMVNFQSALFTNLVYVDSNYKLRPGLIKNWNWNFKNNSIVLTIDQKYKFDQNRNINIKDIEYALIKSFLSDYGIPFRNYLLSIKGTEKLQVGEKFVSGMCSGIKLRSKNRIEIFLKAPNPNFMYTLQNGVPPVAPIEDFKEDHFNYKKLPRGTGPYYIQFSSKKSSLIRLRLKESLWKTYKNKNMPLTIDFYNEGEPLKNGVDLATAAGTSGIKDNPNFTFAKGTVPESISTIDFNYKFKLAKNKNFRKAIALSIDRSKIIKKYRQSSPVYEVVPTKYMGRTGKKIEYSPIRAKEIYKKIKDKPQNIKAIFHGTAGQSKPYIQELKKQLSESGIPIKFHGKRVLIQFGKDKDALLKENGNSVSFTDPISAVARFIPIKGQDNLIAFPDKRLRTHFKQAIEATSNSARAKSLQEISRILNEEHYTIPLFESYPVYSYNARIRDIDLKNRFSAINFLKVKMNLPTGPRRK